MTRPTCPDLILHHGRILTMADTDRVVAAVAVCGGRIVAVGEDAEVCALAGPQTEFVPLEGRTVLPGLVDMHAHFIRVGPQLAGSVTLYDCMSVEEVVSRLSTHLDGIGDGAPVIGTADCLFAAHFAEGRQVCAADLDRVARDRPVLVADVNKTVVNTYVLEHCLNPDAAPRRSGHCGADDQAGADFGVFQCEARAMITCPMRPAPMEPAAALRTASAAFAGNGITTVGHPDPGVEGIRAICRLSDAGELGTRQVIMPSTACVEDPAFRAEFPGFGALGRCHRFGPAKQFYDRFVMHRTAYMYADYPGLPGCRGETFVSLAELRTRVESAWRRGWPLGIHVTGDRALTEAAQVMADVCRPAAGARSHSIHAYFPTAAALRLHADAGLGVAVQPAFLRAWGETLKTYLGPGRTAGFLPLKTYLRAGVLIGGSSDAPIADWNPFRGMAAAVDRRTVAGAALGPDEALTPREALALYTRLSAQALGIDDEVGSVEVGKSADFAVVDRDVTQCSAARLRETRVERTILAGRTVFQRTARQ